MDAIDHLNSCATDADVSDVSLAEPAAATPPDVLTKDVYTAPAVASFMLDQVGELGFGHGDRLGFVDPAAGEGVFTLEAIDRVMAAWRASPEAGIRDLETAIRAFEIDGRAFQRMRTRVRARLHAHGLAPSDVDHLVALWCVNADFLAVGNDLEADVIVANPPYRRYDTLSEQERRKLQRKFKTFAGRCDLYVVFVERALAMLAPSGVLAVITPDRWLRTDYGKRLRQHIADGFHLRMQIDASDQPVFSRDVAAYPAISVIARQTPGPTKIAKMASVRPSRLRALSVALAGADADAAAKAGVHTIQNFASGGGPWLRG